MADLADVNRAAEAFLQAATHAPQPMHTASACSTVFLEIRMAFPSCAPPTLIEHVAAGLDNPVEGCGIDNEMLEIRERRGRAAAATLQQVSCR